MVRIRKSLLVLGVAALLLSETTFALSASPGSRPRAAARRRAATTAASGARVAAPTPQAGATASSAAVTTRATTTTRPTYRVAFGGTGAVDTATSGTNALIRQVLGGRPTAVRGLRWSERVDAPCRFQVLKRSLDDGSSISDGASWDGCSGSSGDTLTVALADDRAYVRGVAVCQSRQGNGRIKGVRLYAAKVWKTKPQIDVGLPTVEQQQTNCGTWAPAVFCPQGEVAAAVVVRETHDAGADIMSMKPVDSGYGLALQCAPVVWF